MPLSSIICNDQYASHTSLLPAICSNIICSQSLPHVARLTDFTSSFLSLFKTPWSKSNFFHLSLHVPHPQEEVRPHPYTSYSSLSNLTGSLNPPTHQTLGLSLYFSRHCFIYVPKLTDGTQSSSRTTTASCLSNT